MRLLVLSRPKRNDVEAISIPATQTADELGTVQCANMIVLGCLIARTEVVKVDTVVEGLSKALPARKRDLLEVNIKALERGREFLGSLKHGQGAARS